MPSIIQLLPDHVANQIAAGEVVQRPASVVKELLENAVDAGATDIKLIVKDAGKTLVQVIDNGQGMNVTDARMCFERHATSKIRQAEDLFALSTKGFRGEALASIAAIAHVELKTKQDADELGHHIVIEGSRYVSQEVAVLPTGTSFAIKNLFFNIPARRNFLKSEIVEQRHIIDEFQRVALAHPQIHFSMYHNGSDVYNLPISNIRQRIVNIFAGKTNEKLVPVEEETEIVKISGFASKPEFAKKNRSEQFFFVNDRFIRSGYLHHAIMSAYDGLLKDGSQPSYFLYLTVPPSSIDINIHPTKTEIKFDDEKALYAILRAAVKHSLGQFNVAPVLDFDRDPSLDTPYDYRNASAATPTVEFNGDYNPFADTRPNTPSRESSSFSVNHSTGRHFPKATGNWDSLYIGLENEKDSIPTTGFEFEADVITSSLFDDVHEKTVTKTYQLNRKYIVSPIKNGMVIVHQHRAHQRILYENFLKSITIKKGLSQQLLFPLHLYFGTEELQAIDEMKDSLTNVGFVFDLNEAESVIVSGVPVNVSESEVSLVLEQLLSDLHSDIPLTSFSQSDQIAKSMAQSLAVKSGVTLNEQDQENIVNGLFACKEQNVCPFQKTTFTTIRVEDIDKKF